MTVAGKTIVITGSSSGLGEAAATALAEQGAEIAVVGRNPERTQTVARRVNGTAFLTDYDHLDQVRSVADALLARYDQIDVLANNAGGLVSRRSITADGFERTIQSNHLAPFLLTSLLLPRLIDSGARVISTASLAHRFSRLRIDDLNFEKSPWFGGWRAYGTSKLATILFIRELARRTAGTGLTAYSFHPGYVATGFGADSALVRFGAFASGGTIGLLPEAGAAPLIQLASAEVIDAPNGTYFDRFTPNGRSLRAARDDELAARLWERSTQLVGLAADLE